jgi:hypothetical protein
MVRMTNLGAKRSENILFRPIIYIPASVV